MKLGPTPNIRRMTPISASCSASVASAETGVCGGPTSISGSRYPTMVSPGLGNVAKHEGGSQPSGQGQNEIVGVHGNRPRQLFLVSMRGRPENARAGLNANITETGLNARSRRSQSKCLRVSLRSPRANIVSAFCKCHRFCGVCIMRPVILTLALAIAPVVTSAQRLPPGPSIPSSMSREGGKPSLRRADAARRRGIPKHGHVRLPARRSRARAGSSAHPRGGQARRRLADRLPARHAFSRRSRRRCSRAGAADADWHLHRPRW